MSRDVQLIAVPYDTALRGVGMGAGPDRLLGSGLAERLGAAGHRVRVEHVEAPPGAPPAEIRTAFELNRALAPRVAAAEAGGALPVVLAGNCITAVGTLAGLRGGAAVLWFDAHGDFNTPETTTGGFLDGMALATVTGRCWRTLAAGVPGFAPVPEERVATFATRDLDPAEGELLSASAVTVLSPGAVRAGVDAALGRIDAEGAYVHLDLDALDPSEGRVNGFAAPGGLTLEEARGALRAIARRFRVRAVALTAYDPAADPEGRVCRAAGDLLEALLSARGGRAAPSR